MEQLVLQVDENRAALEQFVERKMAAILDQGNQDAIFEPFFQTKAIAREIKRRQTVLQQKAHLFCFEDYGCGVCGTKGARHCSLGMCANCHSRWARHLKESMRRRTLGLGKREEMGQVRDLAEFAQRAIAGEKRITAKAEQRAQRNDTLRQAVEQGLTCGEIAEKYDPDFLKDPKAATERIRVAIYRYVPPAVRECAKARIAKRKHERSARREEIWREAKALHDKGETWRAVTQRLDPEGFAKGPKAAMARIITGSRRVPLVRDLTELAQRAIGASRSRDGRSPSKKNSAS